MHFDNKFSVDLEKKECSCRYWQLSGLPCPHAISCIFLKTNSLDEYIASCYSVESFKNTYEHCLQPVEGMTNWPVSDRAKLQAPAYVRMPGKPKKERRRDPTEPPKGTNMSRVGTVIRCTKCKQAGHNRSTCEERNAAAYSGPNARVVVSDTRQRCTSSKKRKGPSGSSHGASVEVIPHLKVFSVPRSFTLSINSLHIICSRQVITLWCQLFRVLQLLPTCPMSRDHKLAQVQP